MDATWPVRFGALLGGLALGAVVPLPGTQSPSAPHTPPPTVPTPLPSPPAPTPLATEAEAACAAQLPSLEAALDARGQRPIPWPTDNRQQHTAAKFWHSIDGTLEAHSEETEIKGLDCDEWPCIALVALPSDGLLFDAEIQGLLDQRFQVDRPRVVPLDDTTVLSFLPEQPMGDLSPREQAAVERRIAAWIDKVTP